ncbi:M23 family peptidase, partial [Streptomyces sp. SID6648]|nr:M23 family peptidase [Streptomyces sp. SID6648]
MASNRPAPEAPFVPTGHGTDTFGYDAPRAEEGPWEEWNPTAESIRPVRGRHRVAKQRGGLARSSTVLGVGVIAAVGAGGMASAQTGKPPVSISLPDLPNVGSLMPGGEEEPESEGS